jgi:ribonuclease Z
MFALTFLGTSASVPSAERNHPGVLVEAGNHRILVDCGEGTQRQLLRSGAGFRRLDRLLLTHGNFDRVLGIPGLFSTLRLRQSAVVMAIHGGAGTLDVVVRMLAGLWGEGRAPIPLQLVPLTAGQVIDAGEFTIDCFPVRREVRCPPWTNSLSRLCCWICPFLVSGGREGQNLWRTLPERNKDSLSASISIKSVC